MTDRLEQLKSVELCSGLKQPALELIARIASDETHKRGDKIFRHGEPGEKLYLILEGKVRISREIPGMGEEALAVLGPGQIFGEMALLDESPRSADANVHDKCRVLAVPRDGFDDLLYLNKELAYEVLWSIVRMLLRRLRETNDKLTFLSTSNKF
jgi:CRP-like cAMP-binding protein